MLTTPHRRLNPLTREWVLVSPHRTKRPWLGQMEKLPPEILPAYDPDCYLCPCNARAGGINNPDYVGTYSFENDFSALLPDKVIGDISSSHTLLVSIPEHGHCLVVCFSHRHDLTLPELDRVSVENVISTWIGHSSDLEKKDYIDYVQIFENKGAMMGCSNPHPHSQIWAQSHIPNEIDKELNTQMEYHQKNNRPLLLEYVFEEQKRRERILFINDHFSAMVPYWAVWPFEVLVTAHRSCGCLKELSSAEVSSLAEILQQVTTRYDNLFEISFPYSMGFHQAPADGQPHPEWVLHAHFYPPLLRSANVRKFMVGFEMLAMPQRDITPELAAEKLRLVSDVHYKLMINESDILDGKGE